jgi:hypothetical protein
MYHIWKKHLNKACSTHSRNLTMINKDTARILDC